MKKDGGIRPIAIGTTVRRLVSKIACFSVKSDMVNYLLPRQIGFGVKFGCEGAVHSIRTYVRNPRNSSKVFLKVDVKNAFNSVERDVMLAEIKSEVPQLYRYLRQCYQKPTFLSFGDKTISSQVGAQQGEYSWTTDLQLGDTSFYSAIGHRIECLVPRRQKFLFHVIY